MQLTAGVTPLPQSGGSAQSLQTGVTFSHDLCGVITETSIPTAGSAPRSITTGPDGALWFTENGGNKIGRITTAGVITETSIPTIFSAPVGITAGPDGALWFAESCGNKIGRITTARNDHRNIDSNARKRPVVHYVRAGRGAVVHTV